MTTKKEKAVLIYLDDVDTLCDVSERCRYRLKSTDSRYMRHKYRRLLMILNERLAKAQEQLAKEMCR
jgi:hypothetical protein